MMAGGFVNDEWEIEPTGRGTFDVRRNRRPYRYDTEDLDEALSEVRRAGGKKAVVIQPDGYRETVSL